MATTVLEVTTLAKNTFSADLPIAGGVGVGGTAIVAEDTIHIPYPREGKLLLIMNNTSGTKVWTVNAGDYHAKGIGSLTQSFAADDVRFLVLDSDRFKGMDGYIEVTNAASTAGFIQAFALPY